MGSWAEQDSEKWRTQPRPLEDDPRTRFYPGGGDQPWARSRSEHVRTMISLVTMVASIMGLLIGVYGAFVR